MTHPTVAELQRYADYITGRHPPGSIEYVVAWHLGRLLQEQEESARKLVAIEGACTAAIELARFKDTRLEYWLGYKEHAEEILNAVKKMQKNNVVPLQRDLGKEMQENPGSGQWSKGS